MTKPPRLSVGLPVYNGEAYITEALDSLLAQSFEDFELIISDNASTDRTEEICRRYAAADSRIRYVRQERNLGCAGNHNVVFELARGELFKWASDDDLYGRDLLLRCVEALDAHPEVVLAHSWTAIITDDNETATTVAYPLRSSSRSAPERFESMLFDEGGDDDYGVVRSDVLRKVAPYDSYYHADRTLPAEIVLHGPFHQVPEYLYFRRDHPAAAVREYTSVRTFCRNYDPRRANRFRHPVARLLAEYVLGYIGAIRRAPLSTADRRKCFGHLLRWLSSRVVPGVDRGGAARGADPEPRPVRSISVRDVVTGQQTRAS